MDSGGQQAGGDLDIQTEKGRAAGPRCGISAALVGRVLAAGR